MISSFPTFIGRHTAPSPSPGPIFDFGRGPLSQKKRADLKKGINLPSAESKKTGSGSAARKVNERNGLLTAVEFRQSPGAIAVALNTDSERTQQPCRFQTADRLGAARHTISHRPRNPGLYRSTLL